MNYWALLLIIVILIAMYFMLGSFLWGAGYQPTPPSVLRRMMRMARIGPRDRVYDLGAGTGGLLLRSLDEGADSVVGIEIEPIRFLILRWRRSRHPRGDRLELRRSDLFRTDLHDATVVLVFLWPGAMRRLDEKFREELPPGARVVSYWHPLPGWTTREEDRKVRVYAYDVPSAFASAPSSPGS
ncbi:MAG: SAM-dependent methyltransferase [Euryarchaeota archaeon]|nr:SAM-dependent methyltransferase [Euryarchaeota archaeon]MDE1838018.1 SAM-dependent methyltransferase [Euryarchaeota archaeon]MDE1881776.1 SAM-dependent methyltransferase [Euryarchaeota archaeon]MDE2046464.1 SAM-dependent methyltransferase [Thermoplasmata archaeon]